jgi:hypothetical protein
MARSAPMARAERSWATLSVVPMETTTTSPPCFSFWRRASSTPISSKGFMIMLTPSVTIPLLSALSLIFAS